MRQNISHFLVFRRKPLEDAHPASRWTVPGGPAYDSDQPDIARTLEQIEEESAILSSRAERGISPRFKPETRRRDSSLRSE
jgi:hypothetical protein